MTTKSQMTTEACNGFAVKLTKLGYRVYLSESPTFNTYGFFTDGERCVYFQYDIFEGFLFSTCMKPSQQGGSGWRLDSNQSYENMLYPTIPGWSNSNGIFLNENQKLEAGKHSNYVLFVCEDI